MKVTKSIVALTLFFCLTAGKSVAQDIPLFGQKLTNSFIYNPAVAGHTFGSVTLSHRKTFDNFVKNNFLSLHTPFGNHKYGVGVNVFSEKINFVENIYASGAFAYHLNFKRYSTLSMGVAAEYNSIGFNKDKINFVEGVSDPVIAGLDGSSNLDFSFGLHYQNRYFKAGIAANRLATAFSKEEDASVLSEFYSGSVAGLIPFRGGLDVLEPTFNFRKLRDASNIWDIGLYYTYNNTLLAGAAWREGDILSLTAGIKLGKKLLLGYSHEIPNGDFDLGNTNEITLRFDFNEKTYQDRFKQDYKSSLAFRRKTLSSSTKRARVGARSPKSFKKRQKRRIKSVPSPNRRYNNVKKLPGVERRKFNVKKRRRSNYKRSKRRVKPYKRRRR